MITKKCLEDVAVARGSCQVQAGGPVVLGGRGKMGVLRGGGRTGVLGKGC